MSADNDQHSSFLPAFSNVSHMAVLCRCHCVELHTKPPITSSFRLSIIVWKEPRLSLQAVSLLLSAWPSLPLSDAHHHRSSSRTVRFNTGRWLQETRGCWINPLLAPITQNHFHGWSSWVRYWITRVKKKGGHFLPARSGNEAAVAWSSWHAVQVVFPEPRVVFRLNAVWKHCWWLARGARQS